MKKFLLIACLATLVLTPLASNFSIPNNLDYISHFIAISQAKLAIWQGQFPLRFSPTYLDGLPYPLFQFYSPTSYTIAGILANVVPTSPFVIYKLTVWLALLLGGIYFYRLAFYLVKSQSAALVASAAYLTAPYLLMVVNQLGSFNEVLALGVIPAVLFYTYQYFESPKSVKFFLLASLFWYLLATIHIVTFVTTSCFVAAWLLIRTFQQPALLRNLIGSGLIYIFACLLASWYLLPVALFSKYLGVNLLFNSDELFYAHSPSLADLFALNASVSKGFMTSFHMGDVISQIHPAIGLPILLAVGVSFVIYMRQKNPGLLALLILFVAAFLLTWSPFNFWHWLPDSFRVVQYSGRWMGQLAWIGSLLVAWACAWVFNEELTWEPLTIVIGLMILSVSPWLLLKKERLHNIPQVMNSMTTTDAYLINVNQYPRFVQLIDNILLQTSRVTSVNVQADLIKNAREPFVILTGEVTGGPDILGQILSAVANNQVIASHAFMPGPLRWEIPLSKEVQQQSLSISFISHPNIKLETISVGGFLNDAAIDKPKQILPHCVVRGSAMDCLLNEPNYIKLLELPMFYYPQLLRVTVNGKTVPYVSILNQNHLLTAVPAQPGLNRVHIKFQGLVWANDLSMVSWQVFLILGVYGWVRRMQVV